MVDASGLKSRVPHADLPTATTGSWIDFGSREGGQLDKANADKGAVIGIGETCDRWAAQAKARIEKKPWWRIFG